MNNCKVENPLDVLLERLLHLGFVLCIAVSVEVPQQQQQLGSGLDVKHLQQQAALRQSFFVGDDSQRPVVTVPTGIICSLHMIHR